MANKRIVTRGPKRRIEKVFSQVNIAVTNSVGQVVLHTAEDKKTLVRSIIDLTLHHTADSAVSNRIGILLAREPQGVTTISPTSGAQLDQVATLNRIWSTLTEQKNTALEGMKIFVDNKGMRKLDVGDQLVLLHIGSTANNCVITGSILMIFKE